MTAEMIVSVCSVIVAVIIGGFQLFQNYRFNRLECDRYFEEVETQARKFISDNYEHRGLIPLCAVTVAYDACRFYHRRMYNEFRLLSLDVQKKIFEYCGWNRCDAVSEDFFGDCLKLLERAFTVFPGNQFIRLFYDRGKYVSRALTSWGEKQVPKFDYAYTEHITDIVCDAFQGGADDAKFIDRIVKDSGFGELREIDACYVACIVAKSVAGNYCDSYMCDEGDGPDGNYGASGCWSGERIETMEDLFLETLFEIWTNLHDMDV